MPMMRNILTLSGSALVVSLLATAPAYPDQNKNQNTATEKDGPTAPRGSAGDCPDPAQRETAPPKSNTDPTNHLANRECADREDPERQSRHPRSDEPSSSKSNSSEQGETRNPG